MHLKPNLFSPARNLDALLTAIAGFFLIQIFAKHSGIGVSPDTVTYLSSARHLQAGHGFRSFDNLPTSDFPFVYPFFLTIISWITRLDPLQYGQFLNGLLFGLLIYISGSVMNGFTKASGWYKRIVLVCILFSPALQELYSFLWSETIFLILILVFMFCMSAYCRVVTKKWLFISILVCAIACETRYAGVFLIPAGLFLIFYNPGIGLRKRMWDCILFCVLSILPLLVNIMRNYFLIGLAMGIRPKNQSGFFQIIKYFGGVFCDWLGLNRSPFLSVAMAVAVLVIFTISLLYHFKRRKTGYAFEYISAATGLIYCLFMLFSYSLTRYEQFTSRLLSPMFIPLIWAVSGWIPGTLAGFSYRMKWISGIVVLLGASWFLNQQLSADWEYYDGVKDAGIPGYREDPFVESEIVQYLEKNKLVFDPQFPIYSNAGDAVYFVTGLPAHQLPFTDFPKKVEQYYTGYYDHRREYLVWFQNEENTQMPPLDSILAHKEMVEVKKLSDGSIYITK